MVKLSAQGWPCLLVCFPQHLHHGQHYSVAARLGQFMEISQALHDWPSAKESLKLCQLDVPAHCKRTDTGTGPV